MRQLLERIQKVLRSRSPIFIVAVGLFLIILIGALDYVTATDYELDFFYLIPLFFVTWFAGTEAGIATAFLAVLTWLVANQISSQVPIIWATKIWNSAIELAIFLAFVVLLAVLKRNARKLDKTVSMLNATLESTQDGILVVDQVGKIMSFNQRFSEMWKIPASILKTGEDDQALAFVEEQLARPEDFIRKVRELYSEPEKESFDVLEFKDGRTFERYSQPQRIGERIVGRLWSFRDVSSRKQAEALQEAVYRIATATETTKSLDDLFPQIHQIISSVMPAESFYISLYDEAQDILRFPYFKDAEDEPFVGGIQPGRGLTAYVLRTGKSLLCDMAQHYELERQGEIKLLGVPSAIWLGVPLIIEGKTIGAMAVQHYTDPEAYTEREQHMLEFVSTQVAIAITRKQAEKALEDSETELRALFAAMTDVVIVYDKDGHYREVAPTDPGLLIASPPQLVGQSMYDTFPKVEADKFVQNIHTVLETGKKLEIEYSLQLGERKTWFACTISPMQVDSVIWVAHDITNRKRAEKIQEVIYAISQTAISTESIDELYQSIHATLAELVHVENFYIAIYDPSSDLISFPYFVDQYDPQPMETKPRRGLTEYVLRRGQPLLAPAQVCDQLIQKGEIDDLGAPSIDWLGVPLKVGGQVIGVMVTQSYQENIHFDQEDLRLFEFVSTQVAQMIDRKRVEQKIRYMGIHDSLTGLYNRAYFDEELKRLEHGRLFPISVLMADLDELKETNDRDGHAAGDELLCQTAKVLRAAFRTEDVVARIGGDEFAVIIPGVDAKLAMKAEQRVRDNINNQNTTRKGDPLRISMGVSTVEKGGSLVEALKQADEQMYAEKQGKKKNENHAGGQ